MKQVPFWVDDYPRPPGLISELPEQTDVLIIGSGLTGLSAALRLGEGGQAVTVVDQGEIASGASSINAGMASPDVKAGVDRVYATYGPRIGHEMWAATLRSMDMIHDLNRRPVVDAMIHEGGMAALGRGRRQLAAFDRTVHWYQAKFGVEWEVYAANRINELVGGDYFTIALYQPEGIGVHPARLVFGLAQEAAAAGVRLVDHCEGVSIRKETAGFSVETSQGAISTGDVILATNGYTTSRPSREMARLIVPVGSYVIATEPLGWERAESILPGGVVTHTRKRLPTYIRRTPDDRILMGGGRSLHTGLDLEESASDLRDRLIEYWPDLAGVEVTHVWGGKLGIPFDLIPHIGRVEGVWYAMGYGGHGLALATLLGHELAGMLLGEDPPSVFSQIPHNGRLYYRGNPWFLSPASTLYRMLDRLGR